MVAAGTGHFVSMKFSAVYPKFVVVVHRKLLLLFTPKFVGMANKNLSLSITKICQCASPKFVLCFAKICPF